MPSLRRGLDEAAALLEAEHPRVAAAWRNALLDIAYTAASRLTTLRGAAWRLPDVDELVSPAEARVAVEKRTKRLHTRLVQLSMTPILAEFGVRFDLQNPLALAAAGELARRVTRVADEERASIYATLRQAHEDGLSVPNAAKLMRSEVRRLSRNRAETIARTELGHAQNAGSLAAVRITGAASRKAWLNTSDDRTRDTHVEAGERYGPGQGIPLSQKFEVGGSSLDHPHDPDGPPEETVNCRCTLVYEEAPIAAAAPVLEPAPSVPAPQVQLIAPTMDAWDAMVTRAAERAATVAAERVSRPAKGLRVERDEYGNAVRYVEETAEGTGRILRVERDSNGNVTRYEEQDG